MIGVDNVWAVRILVLRGGGGQVDWFVDDCFGLLVPEKIYHIMLFCTIDHDWFEAGQELFFICNIYESNKTKIITGFLFLSRDANRLNRTIFLELFVKDVLLGSFR